MSRRDDPLWACLVGIIIGITIGERDWWGMAVVILGALLWGLILPWLCARPLDQAPLKVGELFNDSHVTAVQQNRDNILIFTPGKTFSIDNRPRWRKLLDMLKDERGGEL